MQSAHPACHSERALSHKKEIIYIFGCPACQYLSHPIDYRELGHASM